MSLVLAAASSVQMQHHHWSWKRTFAKFTITWRVRLAYRLLNVKAPVGTFNKEKVLVGAFSVIVKSSWTFVSSSNTDAASPLFIHCTGPLFSAPGPLTISRWTHHPPWSEGKLHHLGWSIQTQLEAQFEASMQTMKCSMPTFLCSGPNEKWGWKQEREKSSHMTPDHTSKAPCPHTVSQNTLMLCSVSWLALLSSTHTVKFLFF